ncbi:glycosyltransferase [Methylobacterium sp. J-001]|uniref:glycosyltransferase n=1 Tax=Methylobacterium sp. J-001 TaxID=2836609 RepID=UPI001FB9D73E|nr:glycosyltransferase [Methylobacterium sp. J-001]MCJ2115962.1 glycosyltransferase [Methylobacterium sp. J-001]
MLMTDSFAINGRFLTQSMTGVQRYAFNVTSSVGRIMDSKGRAVHLLSPINATDPIIIGSEFKPIGTFKGQAWEQITLPYSWQGNLLNLCNTAPAIKTNQVVCMHDANVFIEGNSYGTAFRLFYENLQPLLARRVTKITTVSKFSAGQIAQFLSVKLSNISILPNGHEHVHSWNPMLATLAPSMLRQTADGQLRPFILALGSRARHKNLAMLLGIAEQLAAMNVDLVIAGGQSNIFASEDFARNENVRHLGFVTDHDLAYLFDRALCLVFPSLTEGFGLPALEAMALGCPVISTDRASLPEICGDAALLAPPNEPELWIKHIESLLERSDLREELIERGRDQALKFSWNDTAQGYLDLMQSPFQAIVGNRKKSSFAPKVAVVVATLGRPEIVAQTLRRIIDRQTYAPESIIISCTKLEDAGEASEWPQVKVIIGPSGLAAQRNTALSAITEDIEIVAFFDDDFIPAPDWIEVAVRIFDFDNNITGLTGRILADGIKGPGLSFADADRFINEANTLDSIPYIELFSPYGCNMAFRTSAIGQLRFDERLVLYGWLEDRDFGAQLKSDGGRLVKCSLAQGVHLGVKSGRIAGDRLGYSQVINPLYMLRKGTMTLPQVADHLFRNLTSNFIKSFSPEPFIDRRGRLRGNLRGCVDAMLGRFEPERAIKKRRD